MHPVRSAIVVGGGTMGLASAWALARDGVAVTVLERFSHVHERGSHGGLTRVIRQAYHEGESYVPLVQQADRMWVELGQRSGTTLLVRTGLLELGPADDPDFRRSIAACEQHGVAAQVWDAPELTRRWPFTVPNHWAACFTPSGGMLRVGPCFDAMRREAQDAGAAFHYGAHVREIQRGDRCGVVLDDGRTLHADAVVVTAGAWLPELLPALLPGRLQRLRRVLTWWSPPAERIDMLAQLPVWAAFDPAGFFYGFPWSDEGTTGLKLACHTTREPDPADTPIDPDTVDRALHESDLAPLRRFVAERFPAATGTLAAHRVCLYTTTPSWHFLVDRDPDDARVIVAGGFSGHGFKFAPAIGTLVSDLVRDHGREAPAAFARARHLG